MKTPPLMFGRKNCKVCKGHGYLQIRQGKTRTLVERCKCRDKRC